jgi:enoyl-CoA hydratase
MVEGTARIGIPELAVGVPFPTAPLEVLRFALAPHVLSEMVYAGRAWLAAEAQTHGLIDEVTAADRLLERALETGQRLAAVPTVSFQLTKRMLRRPALERIRQSMEVSEGDIANAWRSARTHAAIRTYVEKTLGKSGKGQGTRDKG